MSLIDQLWEHVKATEKDRCTLAPPQATDLWADLTQLRGLVHAQSLKIGDLREAISYLADVTESLKQGLEELERGTS